jgi:hypothetical protein
MEPEILIFQGTWLVPHHTSRVIILDLQRWKVDQPMVLEKLEGLPPRVFSWVLFVSFEFLD